MTGARVWRKADKSAFRAVFLERRDIAQPWAFIFSASVRLSGSPGFRTGFSFTPGFVIIGIAYIAAGTSGRANSGCVRNMSAEPERIQTAATRSG
jgi:hypothetical protein